jgi:polysaccharide export outer membrane protein
MRYSLCFLGLVMTLLVGCRSTPHRAAAFNEDLLGDHQTVTNRLNPELLRPPADLFILGPGDQLDIQLAGSTNSLSHSTVGLDGKIYFSFLPGLDVWGMSLGQAKAAIETELAKYVSEPSVQISLRAIGSKSVWLLGRLNKPGIYPFNGSMTLLESLAIAGGTAQSASTITTQDLADLRHSFLMRQGELLPVDFYRLLKEGDMSQNVYLKADDFIFVPSSLSQEIYVLGAVFAPKAVAYSDQMTLISAISGANGTIKDAYLTHVAIVRGSLSQPQITIVDYKAIITGKAPNVLLEPRDIIYVPISPFETVYRYLDVIASTFVRSVAANEGANAVSSRATPVGINVPIGIQ